MELKKLFTEDRAVSPVIAVVLMIAVTVILAAVVAAFALGIGTGGNATPQASWDFDYTDGTNEDSLDITHESGDSINENRLSAVISGAADTDGDPNQEWAFETLGATANSDVSTGTTVTVDESTLSLDTNNDLDLSGATVTVAWASESGDKTATVGEWSGPDA